MFSAARMPFNKLIINSSLRRGKCRRLEELIGGSRLAKDSLASACMIN